MRKEELEEEARQTAHHGHKQLRRQDRGRERKYNLSFILHCMERFSLLRGILLYIVNAYAGRSDLMSAIASPSSQLAVCNDAHTNSHVHNPCPSP
jgi:hypothetical protein